MLPPNQGLAFNTVNMNKKSLAIDLSRPEGADVARRLAQRSDVVVDNMRPGAMVDLGLGWEELRKLRPDLIVASSSGRGATGPERSYLGFASVHQGIGGGAYVTGYADDHPCHSGGDVDLMNAMTLALSIVAALHHRARTGEGQFIDYSQCEGASALVGDLLLAHELGGGIPERMGNQHPTAAPHSVYRAWGVDRWVAIEVHDDATFARLAAAIDQPALAADPRFATAAARKANEAALDAVLAAWIRRRDRDTVVSALEAAGVAVAPVRDGRDLYADRHLRERGAFVKVDHPELGELELVRAPFLLDGQPARAEAAPLLGEHDDAILGGVLGYTPDDISSLRAADVVL
jgi:crotonobetainyl-CoA:carnitine CoA-transferase CaiB-like acyl-CoA transferase